MGGFLNHALRNDDVPDDDLWSIPWAATRDAGADNGLQYLLICLAHTHKKWFGMPMPLPQPRDLPAVRGVLQSFIANGWDTKKLQFLLKLSRRKGLYEITDTYGGLATALARVWVALEPWFKAYLAASADHDQTRLDDLDMTPPFLMDDGDDWAGGSFGVAGRNNG